MPLYYGVQFILTAKGIQIGLVSTPCTIPNFSSLQQLQSRSSNKLADYPGLCLAVAHLNSLCSPFRT